MPVRWSHAPSSCGTGRFFGNSITLSLRAIVIVLLDQQIVQRMKINLRQLHQFIDADTLVDFVDARVGWAALDYLRADVGDKAPVGRAAGGRKLGINAR